MEKMPRGKLQPLFSSSSSTAAAAMLLLLLSYLFLATHVSAQTTAAKSAAFTPQDNYLIDCGSDSKTTLPDKRTFVPDSDVATLLTYKGREIKVVSPPAPGVTLPIYLTATVFVDEAVFSFHIVRAGWHWLRLHFFPVNSNEFDLKASKFQVISDQYVFVHDFKSNDSVVVKEFLVNVTTEKFEIKFVPERGSTAYINAIELVSAPDILLGDVGSNLFPVSEFTGISQMAYQTMYRLNVGGSLIPPQGDSLWRTWMPDEPYLKQPSAGTNVSVAANVIHYPEGESPLIAPPSVYASAIAMGDAGVASPNFNVTWNLDVDIAYTYLVRLHFADIVSKTLNDLYFNVYINGKMGISGLDLSTVATDLSSAYYKDFVVNASLMTSPMTIQIGPLHDETATKNAILNGVEVFRMNNSVGSLDGEYGPDGQRASGPNRGAVAAVGFAMMFGAFVGLGAMAVKWQKRPQDWQKRNSFSSWLLPLHAGDSSFMSSKTSLGSRKSQFYSSSGLGRYFSFAELQEATQNWDEAAVIGVGGFGKVYIAEIDDGTTKVAVKRGNANSEQGIHEFQTEIQMLSKLRHRHLVSLIGYCDENDEMILVYEYMSNGPFRDHLYGKDCPSSMTWKQRLECCIGAARGLHYLHTGTSQGIIHRDVKTTNILLDENFVAKMADFGLSKDAPGEQGHVSTAVKGSFGYLDPEYFRKQQLTEKSDVYSFGVVLLEALCARPAINPTLPREQVNLAEWAMKWVGKGLLDKIIDPTLANHINPESMKKFAEAAEKCLAEYSVDRPTMGDVLWNLEYALQLQEASQKEKDEDSVSISPRAAAVVPAPAPAAPAATPDHKAIAVAEEAKNPADVPPLDEHSGTAMFAQFASLSGR